MCFPFHIILASKVKARKNGQHDILEKFRIEGRLPFYKLFIITLIRKYLHVVHKTWNSVNLNVKFGTVSVELSAESAFLMSYNAHLL